MNQIKLKRIELGTANRQVEKPFIPLCLLSAGNRTAIRATRQIIVNHCEKPKKKTLLNKQKIGNISPSPHGNLPIHLPTLCIYGTTALQLSNKGSEKSIYKYPS